MFKSVLMCAVTGVLAIFEVEKDVNKDHTGSTLFLQVVMPKPKPQTLYCGAFEAGETHIKTLRELFLSGKDKAFYNASGVFKFELNNRTGLKPYTAYYVVCGDRKSGVTTSGPFSTVFPDVMEDSSKQHTADTLFLKVDISKLEFLYRWSKIIFYCRAYVDDVTPFPGTSEAESNGVTYKFRASARSPKTKQIRINRLRADTNYKVYCYKETDKTRAGFNFRTKHSVVDKKISVVDPKIQHHVDRIDHILRTLKNEIREKFSVKDKKGKKVKEAVNRVDIDLQKLKTILNKK